MNNGKEITEERPSNQQVGNAGLYWVCYKLTLHGWNVLPTSRNARGVDIVIYNEDASVKRTVQVKTLSKRNAVPLGGHLGNLIADVMIIVRKPAVEPEAFLLTPSEVHSIVHRMEKDGRVSYWLEPKAYERADFLDNWDKVWGEERKAGDSTSNT
ncbi:MAG: hypothetical protein GX444_03950 [Myxococcales bacterium]|nr:hypothetical protein [Myxococcales bacterium]